VGCPEDKESSQGQGMGGGPKTKTHKKRGKKEVVQVSKVTLE